ncbi:hypothetical protein VTJ83DRAFT_4816 [Remersonia thermophila]|uniref:Uncharacterized protein n=1 Tax=Remersonia thermophila TaxID=72144 RepID=A0ABR4DD24_9PEZI
MHRRDVNELNYRPSAGRGDQAQKNVAVAAFGGGLASLESLGTCPRIANSLVDVAFVASRTPNLRSLPVPRTQRLATPQLCGIVAKGQMWKERSSPRAVGLLKLSRHRGSSSLLGELVVAGKIKIHQGVFKVVSRFWRVKASSEAIKRSESEALEPARTEHVAIPAIATDDTRMADEAGRIIEPQEIQTKNADAVRLQCAIPPGALTQAQPAPGSSRSAMDAAWTGHAVHSRSASPPMLASCNPPQAQSHELRNSSQHRGAHQPFCQREPPKKLRSSLSQPGSRKNKTKRVSFKE